VRDESSAPTSRVALVGFGPGGAAFHAPFVATTPGLVLSAIVTRDAARQEQARRTHPDTEIIGDVDSLWRDAHTFDLVVLSTPTVTHAPLALQALSHGLHVVVDKPLALDRAQGAEMAQAARSANRLVVPYQNRRWDGDFQTVRDLVGSGALGTVTRFESRFDRWRPAPKGGWRESAASADGGGLLLDLGSHLVDQALVLFGPVRSVYAELARWRPGVMGEDDTFLALEHTSGVRSHLSATLFAAQPAPRFRLLGTTATFTKWGVDVQEAALRAGERPGGGDWGKEPAADWGTLARGEERGDHTRVPTAAGDYGAFYRGVAGAIRDGAPPPVTLDEALSMLRILDAARHSAGEGRVVHLADDGAT